MKVVISGYGKMGKMVEAVLAQRGIECAGRSEDIRNFDPEVAKECVCIDFTTPAAIRENYPSIAANFKAAVIGTTGWDDIRDHVTECFRTRGKTLVYASNFSIGVNLLFAAVDLLSRKAGLTGGYSPYIIEMHHCHKLDAPSGTAKTLAEIVEGGMGVKPEIQSVRCGEIPGIHTVGLEGDVDRLKITHEAFSRMGFAQGAVAAAEMADRLHGVYDFKDIIFDDDNEKE